MRRTAVALALFFTLTGGLAAQESAKSKDEELYFVEQLRARGYPDLALEYLDKRLAKDPKYKAILPLEKARTRLEIAAAEPDAAQRLSALDQARKEFQEFVNKNPNHPQAGEARVQVAQVAGLQGRTLLGRALALPEDDESREAQLKKARAQFAAATKELAAMADKLPSPQAKRKAEFERGLLLIEQARTYSDVIARARATALTEAIKLLEKLAASLDNKDPLRWRAIAWAGRAFTMNGQPKLAQKKFNEARNGNDLAAARLARYFDLLGEQEKQETTGQALKRDDVSDLIRKADRWLEEYRDFRNTPESFGVRYIAAKQCYNYGLLADVAKSATIRKQYWDRARQHVRALERTDNEFTHRAQQIKIDILIREGKFDTPLTRLLTFDDCYMRALYEHHQLNNSDKFDTAEKKKQQQGLVVKALERSLEMEQLERKRGKEAQPTDLANAKYLLAGYYLATGDLKKTADVGEALARSNPKARQADTAALWAAQSLSQLIEEQAGADFSQMTEERGRLYELARYMIKSWPGGKAGDFGRYVAVMHLLKKPLAEGETTQQREKEVLAIGGDMGRFQIGLERARQNKFLESVKKLLPIKPDFANYTMAQYQLALAALQVHEDNEQRKLINKPLVRLTPKDKRTFKQIAIAALRKVPDLADGAGPETKLYYLRARTQLIRLLYGEDKFNDMEQLAKKTLADLERIKDDLAVEPEADESRRTLQTLLLYALYGKADADYAAGRYAKVADMLDPVVKDLGAGKYPVLKDNPSLFAGLMGLALRGNLLAEKLTRALQVLDVWKKLDKERGGDKETLANVLRQTVLILRGQVEELRKKKDTEKLNKTIDSFDAFLTKVAEGEKDHSIDFTRLLAMCYVEIGKHKKAAKLLVKLPKPDPAKNPKEDAEEGLRRVAYIQYLRALRLDGVENGKEESLKKAEKLLDEVMGSKEEPGWGRQDINALKEQILLHTDLGYYGSAINHSDALLKYLLPHIDRNAAIKEHYFDVFHSHVRAYYKYGLSQKDPAKRKDAIRKAAVNLHQLIQNHPTLGGEASKKRFMDLLEGEEGADLKKAYDAIKGN